MRNCLKLLLLCIIMLNSSTEIFAQDRNCSTVENHQEILEQNPKMQEAREQIEDFTEKFVRNFEQNEMRNSNVITIPVVVHVVYKASAENISDAQINSQMEVLNKDFRRLNEDASNTPSAFQAVAADTKIEFCLASVDPNGQSTTGITRTQTNQSSFNDDAVKNSNQGGIDAWDTKKYLNIWVCNLPDYLGYAQFPGGPTATDGVVVTYTAFGTIGTANAPFNLGRTATHEVGHWLNLSHIWGDGACGQDDLVADTPESDAANYGCATSHTSCGSVDMVQNYMDYSDDACMNLFTNGQKIRMLAALNGPRAALLTSNGCGSTPEPESSCTDGVQNGDETGIDCGGSCAACPTCTDGIQNGNETGVDCGGACTACNTCSDGIQNGNETGVDCGGSCASCPTCSDGIQNGDETGVDCGGACASCNTCSDGIQNGNETGVDCGGACASCATCSDGIQNGTETGVDCGGSCSACASCSDGIQNGDETGVDCGGSCSACPAEPSGSCNVDNPTDYFTGAALDADCVAAVQAADTYCCNNDWDYICQQAYDDTCNEASTTESACQVIPVNYYSGAALNDLDCVLEVQANDPYCCDTDWDGICQSAYDQCFWGYRQSGESELIQEPFAAAVYPNPAQANAMLSIELSNFSRAAVSVSITDISGRLIVDLPATRHRGKIVLDTSPFALDTGLYIVSVRNGRAQENIKLIIQ